MKTNLSSQNPISDCRKLQVGANSLMDKFDTVAAKVWGAILAKIEELQRSGMKQVEVAKMLGISKGTLSNWISGERKAQNASFADMLRYVDKLGLSLADFMPVNGEDCGEIKCQLEQAQERISILEKDLAVALARAQAFQEVIEMNSLLKQPARGFTLPE